MKELIRIKGVEIGTGRPKICLPLISKNKKDLLREAEEIIKLGPDLIEWRVDYFDNLKDIGGLIKTLEELSFIVGKYPLIFTCRKFEEGGYRRVSQSQKVKLMEAAIKSRKIDIVDMELANEEENIKRISLIARENRVKIILSHHDFKATPGKEEIIGKLVKAQELGADIGKIALMPKDKRDVLKLLEASLEAGEKHVHIPLITMAMGDKGQITRIVGGFFGSAITFARGRASSAPGQLDIGQIREIIGSLY